MGTTPRQAPTGGARSGHQSSVWSSRGSSGRVSRGQQTWLPRSTIVTSCEAYLAQGDITEFLIPEKPVMAGVPQFVGWGGVAPIQLLLENLFGLRVDAPARTIHWRIRQTERHGVERFPLGDAEVALLCEARPGSDAPADLTITSTGRFTLTVELPGGVWQREIEPGQTLWLVENR